MLKLLILDRSELRAAVATLELPADVSVEWIHEFPSAELVALGPIIGSKEALFELLSRLRAERIGAFSQLARGIGHELGNILLKIVGKADLASMESDITRVREHLGALMEASDRATLVVRNLQSFGRTQFQLRPTDIGDLVTESLTTLRGDADKVGVTLECDPHPAIQVAADRSSLLQAISNLILNGIQASSTGGRVHVSIEQFQSGSDRSARIRITDSGRGIPETDRERIFEFGFTTRPGRGSGVGLSIAREIVLGHRGSIKLAQSSGAGSEFWIQLPEFKDSGRNAVRP